MDEKDKCRKRLAYNKKWIASKRNKNRQTKRLELEAEIDLSGSDEEPVLTRPFGFEKLRECTQTESLLPNSIPDTHCVDDATPSEIDDTNNIDKTVQISSSDSGETDDEYYDTGEFKESLRNWVNTFEIKANAVDQLLKLLNENGVPDLPATSRTLLKTPRDVQLRRISDVDYFYFGFSTMLDSVLKNYPINMISSVDTLELLLNIDGFPLFKSSQVSAWPLLGAICNLYPCKPFPVSITVGIGKPSNLDFLNEGIQELQNLIENGFTFNEKHYQITLKCVICDAPAKSFVKNIILYSGYFGCDRCTQKGVHIGRMTYPLVENITSRTNQSFRNVEQEEHHKGISPFLDLQIDMVSQFPIDNMHQVCLGATKKLLLTWIRGFKKVNKLSIGQIDQISLKMITLKRYIRREFARKPCHLAEIDRWKATEF